MTRSHSSRTDTLSISTKDLSALPDASRLDRVLRSYALLDAVLCPEWEYRYYSFDRNWSGYERLGSMRNGQGDHFFALFNDAGCFLKGFDHESPMSPWQPTNDGVWNGLLVGVPECFSKCLAEPAFDMRNTTFCIWREYSDEKWNRANIVFPKDDDPDGSEYLLSNLDGEPHSYANWAESYYEVVIDREAVSEILSGRPLTASLVERLNPGHSLALMQDDLDSIGWSIAA